MGFDEGVQSRQLEIKINHKPPPNIDRSLFDSFFQHPAFVAWATADRPWQLHLSGGPGCGKTTLSSLIATHLKRNAPHKVATIFIQSRALCDVTEDALCVDDILGAILDQLRLYERLDKGQVERCIGDRKNTDGAEKLPCRLTNVLRNHLGRSLATFLIVDGFDQLPRDLQSRLEEKLRALGPRLRVLLTRRVPLFQPLGSVHGCNGCEEELGSQFWQCSLCDTGKIDAGFDVCYNCKENNVWCNLSGHQNALVEPYDHIDVEITHDNGKNLELFALRDLEREYNESESPLIEDISPELWTAQLQAQSVIQKSRSDLAITKLRLDHVRETGSFHDIEAVADRLPRGIVAFYDSELDRIQTESCKEMELILVAFLIITEEDGIRIDVLEEALRYIAGTSVCWLGLDYPYVRNVLRLARGLLCQVAVKWSIYVYHPDFSLYVREGYNQNIAKCWATFEKYQEWDTLQAARRNALNIHRLEMQESPQIDQQAFGVGQPTDPKAPPSVLSRQTSTDSTDSGYFSSPSPPLETKPNIGSILQGANDSITRNMRQVRIKHPTRRPIPQAHSLCMFCQEMILQNQATFGYHHRPFAHLQIAANQGCPFCSNIYVHTRECAKKLKLCHNALHDCSRRYWTLRTTGKVSNGYDVCVITFQAPSKKGEMCFNGPKIMPKRFFLVAETDLDHIPAPEALRQSTQLKDAGAQINSWIQNCDENHPDCEYRSTDDFVPTRLVDIGTEDSQMVRIVETAKNGITRPYVTLSHCWGKKKFITLRRVNEKLLTTEGVRISELTRNFQEAIQVARFIGMRYIWIDSICIVQGDDGDFHTEGQYMHKVYRFSYCNIVAADSPDSTYGLFRDRDAKSILPAVYEAGDDSVLENGTWRILEEDLWQRELLETPIYTRGWVFQERMLSPRILHFTKYQVYWDCSTRSACETLPEGLPFSLDRFAATDRHWRGRLQETSGSPEDAALSGANDDSMESFWKTALLKYTECDLTNQGDKAVAVWSIAKLVRDQLAREQLFHNPGGPVDEYGGGLWSIALHEQLAWRARDVTKGARLEELQAGSPSWSWASVNGAILAQDRIGLYRYYAVESHDGEDVSFQTEDLGGNRDKMPRLKEPFSMDMNGYLEEGCLIRDGDESGTLRFERLPSQDSTEPRTDEVFQVYPDQDLNLTLTSPRRCHIVILAASNDEDFILSERDEPAQTTKYSGIGLVLEPYEIFARSSHTLFKEVLRQFFKQSFDPSAERWARDASVKRVANLSKVLKREKLHSAGPHFRRIGAVHFRNVSAETWKSLEDQGRTKFWLD